MRPRGDLSLADARELLVCGKLGAAYEADGTRAEDTVRRIGEDMLPWERRRQLPPRFPVAGEIRVCDEEVIWGGVLINHYGHFLTESTARLWPLLPGGELMGLPVVFAMPESWAVQRLGAIEQMRVERLPAVAAGRERRREWLDAFGVRIVELPAGAPVRFTRMFVPEPAWRLNAWMAPEVRDIHLHARRGLEVPRAARRELRWLSRSELPAGSRPCGERALERLLSAHAEVIHPEQLSLGEQVAALEASEAVAGPLGSAFHTLLLAAELPECIGFCRDSFQSAYDAQDRLLGTRMTFVEALVRQGSGETNALGEYRLLIPDVLRTLAETALPKLLEDPRLEAAISAS